MKVKDITKKLFLGTHPTIIVKKDIRTILAEVHVTNSVSLATTLLAELEDDFGNKTVESLEVQENTLTIFVK